MKFGKTGKYKKKKIQSGNNDMPKVESVDFINEQNELENTLLNDGNDEQSLPKGLKNSKGIADLVKKPKMHAMSTIPLNSNKLLKDQSLTCKEEYAPIISEFMASNDIKV